MICPMSDLFAQATKPIKEDGYTADDIMVLEGREAVRMRPGMFIGGTDDNALHHLAVEIIDNAMDEVVAGHANRVEMHLSEDGSLTIRDNGRGIPVEKHPKFPKQSTLEVVLTVLHAGGKFSDKLYQTAGGLHGVGVSVVNALSSFLEAEVVRDKVLWRQTYREGIPEGNVKKVGPMPNRRGTRITFIPDKAIFGEGACLKPKKLYAMAKAKAYLFRGVEIRWSCDACLVKEGDGVPSEATLHFPSGLKDYLTSYLEQEQSVVQSCFYGQAELACKGGKVEWAIGWVDGDSGFSQSYCNTISTPQGGTHENGLRQALTKGIRHYAEMTGVKKASIITPEDVFDSACVVLSAFIPNPQFLGQTKEKLVSSNVAKLVETAMRDHVDHWLGGNRAVGDALIGYIMAKAESRLARKSQKATARKTITQRLRLPGKLTDCTRAERKGTEIFVVEGDSAGGSAKSARNRETQAILPLRGKILNVASSSADKTNANQALADLALALGCGTGKHYDYAGLRYDRVIIMTDADVDGAHIASLLMTFFYCEMPHLISRGHLYLAKPPLYRLVQGANTYYAQDDKEKDKLLRKLEKKRGNIEVGRFKGLGEMTAKQLKETTMDPASRQLLRVELPEEVAPVTTRVNHLMGNKAEHRFRFIQERALEVEDIDGLLDV